jgi:amidohydrolase
VHIKGTIRSHQEEVREDLWSEVRRAFQLSEHLGGSCEVKFAKGYPALFNAAEVNGWMRNVAHDLVGEQVVSDAEFGMGAEDFAYMTKKTKGAMFLVGAATPDGIARHHHTETFDIDESVLPVGAAILAETARRFVMGELAGA